MWLKIKLTKCGIIEKAQMKFFPIFLTQNVNFLNKKDHHFQ